MVGDEGTDGVAGGELGGSTGAVPTAPSAGPVQETAPQRWRRKRRENVAGGRHHSHRVKVTPEEEARLLMLAEAQGVSVARLLVESALSGASETPTQRREIITELFALHRLVSNIANNVNQLARVANTTSEILPETVHYLREGRRLVRRIDAVLEELARP